MISLNDFQTHEFILLQINQKSPDAVVPSHVETEKAHVTIAYVSYIEYFNHYRSYRSPESYEMFYFGFRGLM